MVEAAETAARFIAGRARADLDGDQMLLFALVRAIEILGEAASRVTRGTRAALPLVPWGQIDRDARPDDPGALRHGRPRLRGGGGPHPRHP